MSPSPYPRYQPGRHEQVEWFAEPLVVGTCPGPDGRPQGLVALGLRRGQRPCTCEALVIDRQSAPGQCPVLLGRLLAFSPSPGITLCPAALAALVASHGLRLR